MSRIGAAPRAAVSAPSARKRAAAPVSNARAEASRRNGAKSRGPKTPAGKARSSLNALRHGMRAAMHVVLPDEDAVAFAALQAALFEELAPVGALQLVLARRVAVAAWRLARADRIEAELFEERRWDDGDLGLALIRDGNGTRSFETLMRYRSAAMAEFTRALRTLKALQAKQALEQPAGTDLAPRSRARKADGRASGAPVTGRSRRLAPSRPNEPEKARKTDDLDSGKPAVPAIELPTAPRDGAHACPEPCSPSARPFHAASSSRVPAPLGEARRTQEPM
jgi:hypothetical protein